jgi:hypothetical protein
VQLYDAPSKVNNAILTLSKDRRTGKVIDISDPTEGKVLCFDRKGTGIKTEYEGFELQNDEPVPPELVKQVLPWDKLLVFHEEAEILKSFQAGAGTPAVDDGDAANPNAVQEAPEVFDAAADTAAPAVEAAPAAQTAPTVQHSRYAGVAPVTSGTPVASVAPKQEPRDRKAEVEAVRDRMRKVRPS